MRMFFIGGVLSLISTMILYQFVTFSTESQYYGIMTITDAFIVGFVEELGKATVVILFINYLKQIKYSMDYLSVLLLVQGSRCLNQLVISLGLDLIYLMELIILLKSLYKEVGQLLGSHLVWAAIVGAAAVIVKETKHFEWANIIDKRFIFFFLWQ